MIVYSVTVAVDRAIEEDWLSWMRDIHIPDVMATGYFEAYGMQKLIDLDSVGARVTYTINYYCESLDKYKSYRKQAAPKLQDEHTKRYRGRFSATRTLSEIIAGGPAD
jgi:hypothetical protein